MQKYHIYLFIFSILFFGAILKLSAQELCEPEKQLWIATQKGDTKQIKKLLKKGANPHCLNEKKESPIYWLLKEHKFDLAEFFIKNGTDINQSVYKSSYLETGVNLLSEVCQNYIDDTAFRTIFIKTQSYH